MTIRSSLAATIPLVVLAVIAAVAETADAQPPAAQQPAAHEPAALPLDESKAIALFDGKSLDGWGYFLVEPDKKMDDVWSVADGMIVCKGKPNGYLYTKGKYKNFHLVVEWRWAPGEKPGNSGVLLRMPDETNAFITKCLEAQLWATHAGDLYGFRGFHIEGPADRFVKRESKIAGTVVGVRQMKSNEKEPGQWNRYDITFNGDRITVFVNGEKVNEATACDVVAGHIGLQSEGAEIHFRTVKLVPLRED